MKKETAKRKLFEGLDNMFRKFGGDAGMATHSFFPHYSEIGAESMRPTWYTIYEFDGCTLFTMYECERDMCLSTLFEKEDGMHGKSCIHLGYPKNEDDAREIADMLRNK